MAIKESKLPAFVNIQIACLLLKCSRTVIYNLNSAGIIARYHLPDERITLFKTSELIRRRNQIQRSKLSFNAFITNYRKRHKMFDVVPADDTIELTPAQERLKHKSQKTLSAHMLTQE